MRRLPVLPVAISAFVLTAAILIAGPQLAHGGDQMNLDKTADTHHVVEGGQIGFTITFTYHPDVDENGTTLYIEDDLPSGPGVNWSIESSNPPGICEITGAPPHQHLECVGTSGPPPDATVITVHVISPTNAGACNYELANQALAGPPGPNDEHASDSVTIDCLPATESPSPTVFVYPLINWGGIGSWGNVELEVASAGDFLRFDAFDAPASGCAASVAGLATGTRTIDFTGVVFSGGHFEATQGTDRVVGDLSTDGHGSGEGDITVNDGTACEETTHFDVEPADRVLLQGDIDCSWDDQLGQPAAVPAGTPVPTPPPNPNKSITVGDFIELIKWVAGLAEDSPVKCPVIGDLLNAVPVGTPVGTATPAPPKPLVWGDVDCETSPMSSLTNEETLALIKHFAQLDPPTCGKIKVGQFFLLDK